MSPVFNTSDSCIKNAAHFIHDRKIKQSDLLTQKQSSNLLDLVMLLAKGHGAFQA